MSKEEILNYYTKKKKNVLRLLRPFLEGFIQLKPCDYEYKIIMNDDDIFPQEQLIILHDTIGCSGNSIEAILLEAFGWAMINFYERNTRPEVIHKSTKEYIMRYWLNENKELLDE